MFQGKQSAYMLFYRRQSLSRPSEGSIDVFPFDVLYCSQSLAIGNCYYKVPLDLQDAVVKANELLRKERY